MESLSCKYKDLWLSCSGSLLLGQSTYLCFTWQRQNIWTKVPLFRQGYVMVLWPQLELKVNWHLSDSHTGYNLIPRIVSTFRQRKLCSGRLQDLGTWQRGEFPPEQKPCVSQSFNINVRVYTLPVRWGSCSSFETTCSPWQVRFQRMFCGSEVLAEKYMEL